MEMNNSEYLSIQNQLQNYFDARYDARYVHVSDCEKTVEKEEKKIDQLTVEFAKSNTKLNILIGILSTIAVPIVGVCVKLLFGG